MDTIPDPAPAYQPTPCLDDLARARLRRILDTIGVTRTRDCIGGRVTHHHLSAALAGEEIPAEIAARIRARLDAPSIAWAIAQAEEWRRARGPGGDAA